MGTAVGEVRENFEELARLAGAVFGPKGCAKVHEMAIESLLWQQEGISTTNKLQAQKTERLESEITELRQKLDDLVG